MQENDAEKIQFENVNVTNISCVKSNITPYKDFNPDALIYIGSKQIIEIATTSGIYVKQLSLDPVSIFTKDQYSK